MTVGKDERGSCPVLIVRVQSPRANGIYDYCTRLVRALAEGTGRSITLLNTEQIHVQWTCAGVARLAGWLRLRRISFVCLQYNPYMYGRWGVCIPVVVALLYLRVTGTSHIAVTFHETYSSWSLHPWHAMLSAVQRLQFAIVSMIAHAAVLTTGERVRIAQNCCFWKRGTIHYIPVGANITPPADASDTQGIPKRGVSAGQEQVICAFGLLQDGVMFESVIDIMERLVYCERLTVRLLMLGDMYRGPHDRMMSLIDRIRAARLTEHITIVGFQTDTDLSDTLSSAHVMLFLRREGATTRSGTLAAALAHGLPVVALRSRGVERFLEEERAVLVADSIEDVGSLCVSLLRDEAGRLALSQRGLRSYQNHLSWQRIAAEYENRVFAAYAR